MGRGEQNPALPPPFPRTQGLGVRAHTPRRHAHTGPGSTRTQAPGVRAHRPRGYAHTGPGECAHTGPGGCAHTGPGGTRTQARDA